MPDMVAIISRAVYDRDFSDAKVGAVVAIRQYVSTNAALTKLAEGGRLFLLSVRPPDEALWLLGVLNQPRFTGTLWVAEPNTVPVTDLSSLRARLRFENGKGLPSEKGKLGMSLQTPRVLHADDVALLDAVLAGKSSTTKAAVEATPKQAIVLNEHETQVQPCLCKTCLPAAPEDFSHEGQRFVRRWVTAKGRTLHFWVPVELADEPALLSSVRGKLLDKLERRRGWKTKASSAAAVAPTNVVEANAAESEAEEPPQPFPEPKSTSVATRDVEEERPSGGLSRWLRRLFGR